MGVEAGGDDAGVVEDEEVAGGEERREAAEVVVGAGSGVPVYAEEAAVSASLGRVMGDGVFGMVEEEVGDALFVS